MWKVRRYFTLTVKCSKCCTFIATVATAPSVAREVRADSGYALLMTTLVLSETPVVITEIRNMSGLVVVTIGHEGAAGPSPVAPPGTTTGTVSHRLYMPNVVPHLSSVVV